VTKISLPRKRTLGPYIGIGAIRERPVGRSGAAGERLPVDRNRRVYNYPISNETIDQLYSPPPVEVLYVGAGV